ncbi:MAG: aspartate carbamoyltransferase [Betaproteobacteria bacterium]
MRAGNVGIAAVFVAALVAFGCAAPSRQDEVASKGAMVMPFDLARTTHYFDDRPDGGVQAVTANDPADAKQVALIRAHLAEEAQRFARGEFSDPAAIHGSGMPGLATLAKAHDRLRVAYRELPAGASITYASADPAVVEAVHQWFAAQRSDHAAHEHMHGHMHH